MRKLSIIGALLSVILVISIMDNAYGESNDKIILPLVRGGFQDIKDLITTYNSFDNDFVVAFPGPSMLKYTRHVNGEKIVSYFSAANIIKDIDALKDSNIEWVAYDLEGGLSPQYEVNDPINSVKRVADVLHSNNMKLVLTIVNVPNFYYVVKEAVKYADMYITQGQRFQDPSIGGSPDLYAKKVIGLIDIIKKSNPNIIIIAQVSLLKGDLENCKQSFANVADYVDGVTLFYGTSKSELPKIKEFYSWIVSNY
ncbi:MAG: hypothetical protein KatS3mg003_1763 [Candidatus Nitrosocaldaceae archaeon]|nr:MAG: hypothetical protein KatS3mg003_1763 [Candidatus Nitrosocaldaceae archaeon]